MRYPADYPQILSQNFHTIIAVDLETTGFDSWRNEILTWSMSALDYSSLKRKASIELTFRPKNLQYWGKGAEEKHGISLSQALYFGAKEESTYKALEFIGDHCLGVPQILVCHAFDKFRSGNYFDVSMIMGHMEKMGKRHELYKHLRFFESTDTYFREARRRGYYRASFDLFSESQEGQEGEDFKLPTLCAHYKIPLEHHNAKSDREAVEALYKVARSLGTNEEEEAFNLEESSVGKAVRGGEEVLRPVHSHPRWLEASNDRARTEEAILLLPDEA